MTPLADDGARLRATSLHHERVVTAHAPILP